jgi:hypothetical protein
LDHDPEALTMINESSPWKIALARDSELIERWGAKTKSTERRSFLIEQKIFLAAYSLRKLDEATTLSTSTLSTPIPTICYPSIRSGYASADTLRLDRYFDLENGIPVQSPARRLINVIIHSLTFVEVLADDSTTQGFLVTSDHEAERGMIRVGLSSFTGLMRCAASDFPSAVCKRRDSKTGRWRIWAGHRPVTS